MQQHSLWVERYRPKQIADYIFHDDRQRKLITNMIAEREIPHLLLSGVQGSGKTTLSQILVNELQVDQCDVLTINASDENSVDAMRDKIKNFVVTYAMGPFKIVRLEEADYLSLNAQAVLRGVMEQNAQNARFILTCNYPHKIMPAIRSRCQEFHFSASDKWDIVEYCATILATEHVKFDIDTLEKYVTVGYPDVRKIVNSLQQNSLHGVLLAPENSESAADWKFQLLPLLEHDKWTEVRKLLCVSVTSEEWDDVYRFLYENLDKSPKFADPGKWEEGIIIIAKHLHMHSIVADSEINAAAMFISLGQL